MKPPNILLLFPDQWRGDWMSTNPSLPLRTPNLDRLMAGGMTFNRCYTSSPLCAPARACLASGHDYDKCPAPSNNDDYDLAVPTYYQRLRDTGYRVAGVGKFDLYKGLSKPLDWHLDGSRLLDEWGFTDGIDNEGKLDFAQADGLPDADSMRALLEGRAVSHHDQVMTGLGKWRCTVTASRKIVKGYKDEPDFVIDLNQAPWEDHYEHVSNSPLPMTSGGRRSFPFSPTRTHGKPLLL